ncbi:hypothetical protein BaRGS_00035033 [Batillaria attramentaria]|uniref:Uncharacterized protein n=1 Tax=Batillaria attramentaria TaxID=370345 RepID=A0ABD0JFU9_9CAEN
MADPATTDIKQPFSSTALPSQDDLVDSEQNAFQNSSSACGPPTTLEVLGDHLFAKIEDLNQLEVTDLDVPKLTGILLELGEREVKTTVTSVAFFCTR